MKNVPKNANSREYALQTLKTIQNVGGASDMFIWCQTVTHCIAAYYGKLYEWFKHDLFPKMNIQNLMFGFR